MSDSSAVPRPNTPQGAVDAELKRRFQQQAQRKSIQESRSGPVPGSEDSDLELRAQQLRNEI